eukprot:6178752-Pleurochrysis_carterae.AAC.1
MERTALLHSPSSVYLTPEHMCMHTAILKEAIANNIPRWRHMQVHAHAHERQAASGNLASVIFNLDRHESITAGCLHSIVVS